ncbi:hypothetical protein UPYG_G00012260 [Umbra pygmaea]|uniref:Uncharacterized protein n=1 Tax=Umbra pygmaea TaxID=75934 RepID=A0ABD0XM13_UMBPY
MGRVEGETHPGRSSTPPGTRAGEHSTGGSDSQSSLPRTEAAMADSHVEATPADSRAKAASANSHGEAGEYEKRLHVRDAEQRMLADFLERSSE